MNETPTSEIPVSSQTTGQSPSSPDFARIQSLAVRAAAAYETPEVIRERFPQSTLIGSLPRSGIQFFLETISPVKSQVLTVRGTCNVANIKDDADCWEEMDPDLGIVVHRGFDLAARELIDAVLPQLKPDHLLTVTGHSLGAAVSVLTMIRLGKLGLQVGPSINFGQPKVTNEAGAARLGDVPVLRVVDENDLVPLVPPALLFDQLHGVYAHFGPELILLRDEFYVILDGHRARDDRVEGFWRNLEHESVEEHYMAHYLTRIEPKQARAVEVPFEDREKYVVRDAT